MHFLTGGICGTAPQKEEDKWLQDETGSSKMDRSKKGGGKYRIIVAFLHSCITVAFLYYCCILVLLLYCYIIVMFHVFDPTIYTIYLYYHTSS